MCKQNGNITKNLKRNPKEFLELESTVTEMKNPQMNSNTDLCRQEKVLSNLKIGKWKFSSLRNRKEKD